MRSLMLQTVLAGLPQIPADYPGMDPACMSSTSTEDAPPDGEFDRADNPPQFNRHERRKAAKLNRNR